MPRTRPTHLYAIASVALVLFMLGFFALTAVHGSRLVALFKEKVDVWLELKPDLSDQQVNSVITEVRRQHFVLKESVTFITREQAQAAMREDLGEGGMISDMPNLFRDVVRFNVQADYLDHDSLSQWREQLRENPLVADLYIEAANTSNVGRNIENLGWITLGLGVLLLFAAVTLIHNTIRLELYANRFIIKNQELVGASWGFISRPYLRRGMLNGLWSAVIAVLLLIGLFAWMERLVDGMRELQDMNSTVGVFAALLILGVLLSGLSTWWVVHKFLRMKLDDLY
ncbi:MAG TPA: permease-like cell division protein FtsX [Saprospiraceae bacterium]|nr:permease-like cell division protein FtsX [Saprospiraceae bacterium]